MTPRPSTDAVWSRLNEDLRRFIRRRVSDEHVAEDLLQETFLRIHRHAARLNDADRLAAWVYQIARNAIHDHYRRVSGAAAALTDAALVDEAPAAAEERSACAGCRADQWLDEMIRQLPAKHQEAVRLCEVQGLSQQEVADRLGLSLSGAKSRIQRGRAMLKGILEQCCTLEFDRRGNVLDYDPKPDRTICRNCDDRQGS